LRLGEVQAPDLTLTLGHFTRVSMLASDWSIRMASIPKDPCYCQTKLFGIGSSEFLVHSHFLDILTVPYNTKVQTRSKDLDCVEDYENIFVSLSHHSHTLSAKPFLIAF
jgi:hypothetical protein